MAYPIKENKKDFTYLDYIAWGDSERWQIINGEPYAMNPAPSRIHQEIIGEIFLQIGNYLRGKGCKVYVEKLNLYERYCIREYWIVNPKNNNIFVYTMDENNQYSEVKAYDINEEIPVGIFENLIIKVNRYI